MEYIDYRVKYLKYKAKYLELQKYHGSIGGLCFTQKCRDDELSKKVEKIIDENNKDTFTTETGNRISNNSTKIPYYSDILGSIEKTRTFYNLYNIQYNKKFKPNIPYISYIATRYLNGIAGDKKDGSNSTGQIKNFIRLDLIFNDQEKVSDTKNQVDLKNNNKYEEDKRKYGKPIKITTNIKLANDFTGEVGIKQDGSDSTGQIGNYIKLLKKHYLHEKEIYKIVTELDGHIGIKEDGSDSYGRIGDIIKLQYIIINNIKNIIVGDIIKNQPINKSILFSVIINVIQIFSGTVGKEYDGSDSTDEIRDFIEEFNRLINTHINNNPIIINDPEIAGKLAEKSWSAYEKIYNNKPEAFRQLKGSLQQIDSSTNAG